MNNLTQKILTMLKEGGIILLIDKVYDKLLLPIKLDFIKLKLNLLKLGKQKPIVRKYDGNYFPYYGNRDRQELLYHARWHYYYDHEFNRVKDYIHKDDCIIDVGANLGFFTIIFSRLTGKNGTVYSFEPSSASYQKLLKTIEINDLSNVKPFKLGCGMERKYTLLTTVENHSGLNFIDEEAKSHERNESIELIALDDFFLDKKERAAFIKIDTEGYEPKVLRGAERLLKEHRPIVYIELGGGRFLNSSLEAINILSEYEYRLEFDDLDLSRIGSGKNFFAYPK